MFEAVSQLIQPTDDWQPTARRRRPLLAICEWPSQDQLLCYNGSRLLSIPTACLVFAT